MSRIINVKLPSVKKIGRQTTSRRRIKNGSYSIAMTAVMIAGAVAVNLIVSELPSQYTKIDISEQQLFSLTDQTKELVDGLEEDVTIYYIVQDSSRDTYVSQLLERYNDISSHITVVEKDPVLHPNFTSQYTDQTLSDNSVIVTCNDASRVISYGEMYESQFNYSYYSYETTGFDGEGQITSAIAAVSSENLPKLYTLTGHGEMEINSTLAQSVSKENIETESLNLVTAEQVPEDADCLLIVSPTTDLSEAEARKIIAYLKTGGKAIIITDYTGKDMSNLESILDCYGLSLVDGVIMEGDSNYFIQIPYYLVPDINSTEISSDMAGGNSYTFLAAAQGIETNEDARETLDISSVLSTSTASYSKVDVENMSTYSKEEGDIDGPFHVAVTVTETVELTDELLEEVNASLEETDTVGTLGTLDLAEEKDSGETENGTESDTEAGETDAETTEEEVPTAQTKLMVVSSSTILEESADQMVSGGNSKLFMNALSWMCGHTTTVSVPVKSMSVDYLTVTSASGSFWSILVIGIIPGIILIAGLVIWLRRRKQ